MPSRLFISINLFNLASYFVYLSIYLLLLIYLFIYFCIYLQNCCVKISLRPSLQNDSFQFRASAANIWDNSTKFICLYSSQISLFQTTMQKYTCGSRWIFQTPPNKVHETSGTGDSAGTQHGIRFSQLKTWSAFQTSTQAKSGNRHVDDSINDYQRPLTLIGTTTIMLTWYFVLLPDKKLSSISNFIIWLQGTAYRCGKIQYMLTNLPLFIYKAVSWGFPSTIRSCRYSYQSNTSL